VGFRFSLPELSVEAGSLAFVPLTFPAHQVAVVPLKLWRPRWFDGTALVVGAGAPDLFNVLFFVDTFHSHHWSGIYVATAFTVTYSIALRRYAVDGLFGSLPDFGPLKARSYRVLAHGRPRLVVTVWSALIGVLSHVIVDSFTHSGRLGARVFGLQRVLFEGPEGPVTAAKTLQYLGHTVGSLIGVLLFVLVVSRRHLGEWYGEDVIDTARNAPVRDQALRRTMTIVTASVFTGCAWGLWAGSSFPVFHIGIATVLGLLLAGISNRPRTNGAVLATAPANLSECLDTSTLPATTSSTWSVARWSRTSRRSVT